MPETNETTRCTNESHSFEYEVIDDIVVFTCVNCRYTILPDK